MLDNVVVAPHAIGFTDQLFGESIASACRSIVAVASGRAPEDALNPDAAAARAAGSTPSVVS
jgi:phosphoglycerate dehydrogenase-like enzyme